MAREKLSRKERLATRFANTDLGGGGGTDFWKPPKDGQYVLRILPEKDETFGGYMVDFFQEWGKHRLLNGTFVTCPSFTSAGELDCPICDLIKVLYNSGYEEDVDIAKKLRLIKQYAMNIIVREDEKDTEGVTGQGPFVYTPGPTVMKFIEGIILNIEYDDVFDLESGTDLFVTRETEKIKGATRTNYDVQGRRSDSPLHKDPKVAKAWMEQCKDLTPVYLTDDESEDKELLDDGVVIKVYPYDRMVAMYGYHPQLEFEDLEALEKAGDTKTSRATTRGGGDSLRDRLKNKRGRSNPVPQDEDEDATTDVAEEAVENTEDAGEKAVEAQFKNVRARRGK